MVETVQLAETPEPGDKSSKYEQFMLGPYYVNQVYSSGPKAFIARYSTVYDWILVPLTGAWIIDEEERLVVKPGMIAGVQSHTLQFFTREETTSTICFIRVAEVSETADRKIALRAIPELIVQILHATFFPAPIPLHRELLDLFSRSLLTAANLHTFRYSVSDLEAIRACRTYIAEHLHTPFSTEHLGQLFAISTSKLLSGFREFYHQSPHDYLRHKKLDFARAELENTARLVKQISKEAGYRNTSNFTIAFKRKFGITPSQVRRSRI